MRRLSRTGVFLISAFSIAAYISAQELPFDQKMDIVYGERWGCGLLMDIFTPTGKGIIKLYEKGDRGKGLAVIHVASGGFDSDRMIITLHRSFNMYHIFCARGYTVFAVRPGSKSRFTGVEMLENIKTAIRYIKFHASDYSIDPDRIGIMGSSAGGHLSCLATVTAEDGNPDAGDPMKRPDTRLAACGVFFPPTDFIEWEDPTTPRKKIAKLFFTGGFGNHSEDEIREMATALSPLRQIKGKCPPFILFHGDADPLVPFQQSIRIAEALRAQGGEAKVIIKKGGQHPWLTITNEIMILADWFDETLATPAAKGNRR
ncbi:MAG TPA: alpha/beta hydrolase [Candidatus Brocadiia bacterium]|nr:alpha/beta hydrolase [Candidatus Brocadiia bacterium]